MSNLSCNIGTKSECKRHIQFTHEGKKPFECYFCPANFCRKDTLKRYIRRVHEKNNEHYCSFCPAKFVQNSMLNKTKSKEQVNEVKTDFSQEKT